MKTAHASLASAFRALAVVVSLAVFISRASAQLVADGQTNVLDGVTTNIVGNVTVGTNGSFTLLMLKNGAVVTNSGGGIVGFNSGANSNEVIVKGLDTTWSMGGSLTVGKSGTGNRLLVSDGGTVTCDDVSFGAASGNNLVVVSGSGSLLSANILDIGGPFGGTGDQLIVSNGGTVVSFFTLIQSIDTVAVVTGGDSTWSNHGNLHVGHSGSSRCRLTVSNGGSLIVGGDLTVGTGSSFVYEHVARNDGGNIIVTNPLGTGTIDVHHGSFALNGGITKADHFLIQAVGSLTGHGTILGNVTNFGSLDVGNSAGAINVSGDFRFEPSATAIFELGGSTPTNGYDQLVVTNFVRFGGTLDLRLINGYLPGPADSFTLVKFASSFGIFQNAVNGQRMSFAGGKASFLVTYETNLVLSAVRYVDTDGDGQGDLQEEAAGTDPNDAGSVLRILSITPNASGHQTVLFQSEPAKTYRVEYSTNLANWAAALTNLPSAGTTTQWTDDGTLTGSLPGTNRFYRVGLQ